MKIAIIGNSHTGQYKIETNLQKYIKNYDLEDIIPIYAQGASIRGLVNPNSTLGLRQTIMKFRDKFPEYFLLFTLGQVDLEFGYYYKCVKNNTKIDIDDYIFDIINAYEKFLTEEVKFNLGVLAINPTVITDTRHNFNVNFKDPETFARINLVNCTGEMNNEINFENVKFFYNDTFELRNSYHKKFNMNLKTMADRNRFKFYDLWDDITVNNVCKPEFRPNGLDHHLIPSEKLFEFLMRKIKG